jgi:hypothetical protein
MDLLGALGVLVRVVETGSFSAVARERELSQAAVARQISQLEEHFGVRLLHRTTRKLSLTDDGQMLLGLARPVLDGVDDLGRQRASPVGLVRVGVAVTASRLPAQRLPTLLEPHLHRTRRRTGFERLDLGHVRRIPAVPRVRAIFPVARHALALSDARASHSRLSCTRSKMKSPSRSLGRSSTSG